MSSPPAILWATFAVTLGDAGSTWLLGPGKAGTPVRICTPPHTHRAPLGPPRPPSIALAAASPSPSCCSPSWLGDPAWGQMVGWGGLRAKPCPPQPLCPHRGAWPGGAPCPVLEGVQQALGSSVPRSVPRFTRGCSTFAALSHLMAQYSTHWSPDTLRPQGEGQAVGPGALVRSALLPHILCSREVPLTLFCLLPLMCQ